MKIRLFDNAKFDLLEGYAFYDAQASGVGEYFLNSLYADIDSLSLYAGIHRRNFLGLYWMLSKRFPYAIYYTVDEDLVSVYAVLDCRQDPRMIEDRLRRERIRLRR